MRSYVAAISSLTLVTAMAIGSADAQQAPQNPDIAGVKLGMTVAQAEAALMQFDAKVKIVPVYGVWSENHLNQLAKIEVSPSDNPIPKLEAVTGLVAGVIDHTYGADEHEITGDSGDPVGEISGDWFRLYFTPSDQGGSLYAVVRRVVYAPSEVAAQTTPAPSSLTPQLVQKYGKPSLSDPQALRDIWLTDVRGKAVSSTNRDFSRCQVSVNYGGPPDQNQAYAFSRADIAQALTDTDGSTLDGDTQSKLAWLFQKLSTVPPDITQFSDPSNAPRFRKCGTELEADWEANDGSHLNGFTTFLVDLDRAYFDNGLEKYFKPAPSSAPVAAPKL